MTFRTSGSAWNDKMSARRSVASPPIPTQCGTQRSPGREGRSLLGAARSRGLAGQVRELHGLRPGVLDAVGPRLALVCPGLLHGPALDEGPRSPRLVDVRHGGAVEHHLVAARA